MTEPQAYALLMSGFIGLLCWFVGIADHLYRLALPRTRRSERYDRIDNAFIYVGSIFVFAFVGGLYYFVQAAR